MHLGTVLDVGAAREVFERLLLTVLDDLEVLGVQIGEVLALPVDDGDAEGGEVDPGAERRRLRGDPASRQSRCWPSTGREASASASDLPILHPLRNLGTP